MKTVPSILLTNFLSFSIILYSISASAQKLPNIQLGGVRAAKNVIIDGRATEIGSKFEAYNHNIDAFYTVSNDDKYLYFTLQATDKGIVNKIITGGITIAVNKKEKEFFFKECKTVTYPVIKMTNTGGLSKISIEKQELNKNAPNYLYKLDSLTKSYNQQLVSNSTEMKVKSGGPNPDSLISVYNDKQILAAGSLDNNGALTYEFRIPLRFIEANYLKGAKIFYNITFSGKPNMAPRPPGDYVVSARTIAIDNSAAYLQSATNFWGEYVLL